MDNLKFSKLKSISEIPVEDIYHLTIKNNSNFFGNGVCLHNCNYRGDLGIKLFNLSNIDQTIEKGAGAAQFIIYKMEDEFETGWISEDEVENTNRGSSGFGSSDLK